MTLDYVTGREEATAEAKYVGQVLDSISDMAVHYLHGMDQIDLVFRERDEVDDTDVDLVRRLLDSNQVQYAEVRKEYDGSNRIEVIL